MTANVTKLEDNKVRLDVEVSPEAVKKGVEAKVKELGRQVRVPGFRHGKAPRRIVENHLGRDYIYYEALQDRLPAWYSEAVVEADLRPINRPEIEFDNPISEEEGFRFSATLEVRPAATLGQYKGLEVPRRETEVSDEQVDSQIEEMQGQFATLAAVEGRPIQQGDFAILDFKGERLAGGPIEGTEAEDYMMEVGRGDWLPEFEENLVGMNADERKQFGVTFPMDYQEESLRGESVLFRVHVKEIKERDLPPLDDEFAKEASEFETLEEFRATVREQLGEALSQQVDAEFRGLVLDAVAEGAEVEVPDVMTDEKADDMVASFERSLAAQGMQAEQYYELAGVSREEMKDRVRDDAADAVKKELVLEAVVEAEGIEADEHEVEHQIEHLAEDSGRSAEDITETMRANGTYTLLEEEVARQAALDFLAENAVAVPMPEEEEEGPEDAQEAEPEVDEARVESTVEASETTSESSSEATSEGEKE